MGLVVYERSLVPEQNRQETDLYLRQLEAESRVEEVYGKGVQLIVPSEGFVVKTHDQVRQGPYAAPHASHLCCFV